LSYRKSQTAIEYCWRFKKSHPDFHIFWIYAGSVKRFIAAYAQIARQLLHDYRSMQYDEMMDGVKSWLTENDNWLMVVDNADDYEDFFGREDRSSDDAIYNSLPWTRPGSAMILYTSRHAKIGNELTDHDCLVLDVMSRADALTLLEHKLGLPVDEGIAIRLLDAIEYLPMCIAHSAAYIKATRIHIDEYLSILEGSDAGLLDMLGQTVRDRRKDLDAPRSVVKAWLVTFNLLWKQSSVAADLFCFMACLDRHNTPSSLISSATSTPTMVQSIELDLQQENLGIELPKSVGDLHSAFAELEAFALIKRGVDRDSFSMHRYVQTITIWKLKSDGRLLSFSTLAADCILAAFPIDPELLAPRNEPDMEVARQLAPTAYRIQSLLREVSENRSKVRKTILYKLGSFYYALGVLHTATTMFAELAKDYGSDDVQEKFTWWQFLILTMNGALDEAEEIAAQIDLPSSVPPGLSFSKIVAMDCHYTRGEYSKAETIARAMLAWMSEHLVDEVLIRGYLQALLAATIGGYGVTAENAGEVDDLLEQAENQLASVPDVMQDSAMPPHALKALLCAIYTDLGKYPDAERMYASTIPAAIQIFGPKHIECLKLRMNRAGMLIDYLLGIDKLDRDALRPIEKELRELYDYMITLDSPAGSASSLTCGLAENLARSVWFGALLERDHEVQQADCDLARIDREYEARLKEAAQYGRLALEWSYQKLGPLSRRATNNATYLIKILSTDESEETSAIEALQVAKDHAMRSVKALSKGFVFNSLDTYCLTTVSEMCIRHEQCHGCYVILLRSNLIQHRELHSPLETINKERQRMHEELHRLQKRQVLLAMDQQNPVTTDLTVHAALCGLCERVCTKDMTLRILSICILLTLTEDIWYSPQMSGVSRLRCLL
jgi:hypothetical protein